MSASVVFLILAIASLKAAIAVFVIKNIRLKETVRRLDQECKSLDEALAALIAEAKVAKETINEILPMAVAYHRVRCDRMNEDYMERSVCAALAREATVDAARAVHVN